MITKVKIAPFEKWCEPMQQAGSRCSNKLAEGVEILIETSSMRTTQKVVQCGGRKWLVMQIPSNVRVVAAETGVHAAIGSGYGWVCEHVLEMD